MFSLAHTVRLVSVSFRSRAVAKRAMSYPFFLRVLICRRCHLWDEMSLGKDNNGREMMRDAFGRRVRLEDHVVARPKKKAARAGGSVRRTRAAWNRTARGPKSGQAKEDTRRIAMIARGLKLPFLPVYLASRHRVSRSVQAHRGGFGRLLNGARTKNHSREPFFSFLTQTTDFEGLHDRELEGAKDVLQEGECRHLLQR